MFTGIVEHVARCVLARRTPAGARIELDLGPVADGVGIGDSIAVDGCCLTVVHREGPRAAFDVVPETISKTTLGNMLVDRLVNVERALRLGDRLGGHLVTGHVDGVGTIRSATPRGDALEVLVDCPAELRAFLIPQGSVTVDGVSLTVAALDDRFGFRVAIVPHTRRVTTLGGRRSGDPVNLEMDVLGKWVARLQATGRIEGSIGVDELGTDGPYDRRQ